MSNSSETSNLSEISKLSKIPNSFARSRLRVGAVSYLNTKPLVFGLSDADPRFELVFDLPSRLADGLSSGELDVALIPSVEYFSEPDWEIVSDACIGCRGPVLSVVLLGRRPLSEIRTLALDEGSRTSVSLARILLKERFAVEPELVPFPIGARIEETEADAILVIGDRAMQLDPTEFAEVWDLGEEWCRWSGLPFVFAMWVSRGGGELGELPQTLAAARDKGVANLRKIARREAASVGLSVEDCYHYLSENLYFHLGSREREGMAMFRRLATEFSDVQLAGRRHA